MKRIIIFLHVLFLGMLVVMATDMEVVKISQIYDGDTIEVINCNNEKEIVRFDGIDCYETSLNPRAYKQAYNDSIKIEEVIKRGIKSKLVLVELFKSNSDKQLYIKRISKDKYNRSVCILYLGEININEYMIKYGGAKKYIFLKY